jgi:hypothetical protein
MIVHGGELPHFKPTQWLHELFVLAQDKIPTVRIAAARLVGTLQGINLCLFVCLG